MSRDGGALGRFDAIEQFRILALGILSVDILALGILALGILAVEFDDCSQITFYRILI